jgi:sugar-phosphatase
MTDPFPIDRSFGAFLFDMDGTILNSIAAAERVWSVWANRHGLDVGAFLPTIHGMRASETIRRLNLSGVDVSTEAAWLTQAEMDDIEGILEIPGAAEFLNRLPKERWAIVTSAPRKLALRRLEAAGLPVPAMMVSGEEVSNGKPAPDCFLLAARRLGLAPSDCLVFEDAPAGIKAAEAAGASLAVVTATHRQVMDVSHATLSNYSELSIQVDENGWLSLSRAKSRSLEPAGA